MLVSSDQDVTSQQPLVVGDKVAWRTATGFKTGGTVEAILDDKVARVRVPAGVGRMSHPSFGVVTIGLAKLERVNPL